MELTFGFPAQGAVVQQVVEHIEDEPGSFYIAFSDEEARLVDLHPVGLDVAFRIRIDQAIIGINDLADTAVHRKIETIEDSGTRSQIRPQSGAVEPADAASTTEGTGSECSSVGIHSLTLKYCELNAMLPMHHF